MASTQAWPAAVLAFLLASAVIFNPAAASKVPSLDFAKWNQAYKLSVSGFKAAAHPDWVGASSLCSRDGFTSDPAAVNLGDCFYTSYENRTYSWWTKQPGDRRYNSNCYCYGLNVYKNGFCIPGSANGTALLMQTASTITCDLVKQGVTADGGREIPKAQALNDQPPTGHYIAMLWRPAGCTPYICWETDFHTARKDSSGYWSWKEPSGPVTDRDLYGQLIRDPAEQILPGHYEFCAYFWVEPDTMTIDGVFGLPTLQESTEEWGVGNGVHADLSATRYNHTIDGAFSAVSLLEQEQDRLWRSKNGTPEWVAFYKQYALNGAADNAGAFQTVGTRNADGTNGAIGNSHGVAVGIGSVFGNTVTAFDDTAMNGDATSLSGRKLLKSSKQPMLKANVFRRH
eukprot:GHRR01000424.1.p1 GENE.GHRR01000424.1~~GHRR01000424.1.p1  ORF type:complete len:399 (+),score=100.55 GHRR01000424.1:232-1428(+)